MCLSVVDKKLKHKRRSVGWKVMTRTPIGVEGQYYPGKVMIVGNTYTDKRKTKIVYRMDSMRHYYLPGYHIYLDRDKAERTVRNCCVNFNNNWLCAVRVKFSDVVATGTQGMHEDTPVVVAKTMTIQKVLH